MPRNGRITSSVIHARLDGPEWVVAATALAMPALRRYAGQLHVVGLLRDRGDHLDDVADLGRRRPQLVHGRAGGGGEGDGSRRSCWSSRISAIARWTAWPTPARILRG